MISKPVENLDKQETRDKMRDLIFMMHYYMHEWNGMGLSAVQVGRLLRIIVIDTQAVDKIYGKKLSMINPEIVSFSEDLMSHNEECLSFPAKALLNNRFNKVVVKFYTHFQMDESITEELEGITAFCFQHEFDHLDGLTIDRF